MSSKIAYIDIDGVVLDSQQGFVDYFADEGIEYRKENCTKYNFSGNYEIKGYPLGKLFTSYKFFSNLKQFPDAESAVASLLRNNYTVYGYTMLSADVGDDIVYNRCAVLERLGMIPLVTCGKSKGVHDDASLLVEDCAETVAEWLRSGSSADIYLVDYPYNRDLRGIASDVDWSHVTRVHSLYEAVFYQLFRDAA